MYRSSAFVRDVDVRGFDNFQGQSHRAQKASVDFLEQAEFAKLPDTHALMLSHHHPSHLIPSAAAVLDILLGETPIRRTDSASRQESEPSDGCIGGRSCVYQNLGLGRIQFVEGWN